MTTNARRQLAAARAREVPGLVGTVATTNALVPRIDAAGTRFGFTRESGCGKVLG